MIETLCLYFLKKFLSTGHIDLMNIAAVALQVRVLPKLVVTDHAVHHRLSDPVHRPLVVPFVLQSYKILFADLAAKLGRRHAGVAELHVLLVSGLEMEDLIAIRAGEGSRVSVVIHVTGDHFLRVEFSLA